MSQQLALLPEYLTAHLELTLVALLLGTLCSVPLGVLVARVRWIEQPVLSVASVIQTIPSLALLAIMVPLLAAAQLRSIGYLPAIIGLFLYSILPILRNTVAGLAAVEPALIEAARGVGMTPGQQLRRVELPLAMPVIVAGIRTATVWTVGMATLATPVGATSLGNYIFAGLQTRNLTAVMVGCIAASALALVLDGLVHALEVAVRRRSHGLLASVLAVFALLYTYTGASLARGRFVPVEERITIGAKTFTEQYILSEILAQQIQHATGLGTRIVPSLGSTVAFDALRAGEIDVYVDYSGTIWATIMHRDSVPENRVEVLRAVRQYLRDEDGIVLVGALGFENAYALAMRERDARRREIRRISDLVPYAPQMSIGGDYEFFSRPEWRAIQETYQLHFSGQRSMDSSLMYQAAARGEIDVISAFSTDGRIAAFDLRVLDDDRRAIPPYDAIMLASPRLVREHATVIRALGQLTGTIEAAHMRRMNLAVDARGQSPAAVATQFLHGLARQQASAPGRAARHPDRAGEVARGREP